MTRFTTAAVATIIALAASAGAHAQTGFYVTGSAGFAKPRDAGIKNENDAAANTAIRTGGKLEDLDRTPVFGLGAGYRFSPMFRADLTYTHRNKLDLSDNDGGSPNTATPGQTFVNADIKNNAVFLTGYADFRSVMPEGLRWFDPYVGAGIGYSRTKVGSLSVRNVSTAGPDLVSTSTPSGSSSGVGWQLVAGVGFSLTNNLKLDVGYRYVDLGSIKVDGGTYSYRDNTGFTATTSNTSSLKGDLRAHELAVGLRYEF